jgi:hypothetical protein
MEERCPQCGCSAVSHLSAEEIKARFKGVDNVEPEAPRLKNNSGWALKLYRF